MPHLIWVFTVCQSAGLQNEKVKQKKKITALTEEIFSYIFNWLCKRYREEDYPS